MGTQTNWRSNKHFQFVKEDEIDINTEFLLNEGGWREGVIREIYKNQYWVEFQDEDENIFSMWVNGNSLMQVYPHRGMIEIKNDIDEEHEKYVDSKIHETDDDSENNSDDGSDNNSDDDSDYHPNWKSNDDDTSSNDVDAGLKPAKNAIESNVKSQRHPQPSRRRRRHRRTPQYVTKNFQCQECGKYLSSKNSLKVHGRQHTGETPFECTICHHRFKSKPVWNAHMQRIHKRKK